MTLPGATSETASSLIPSTFPLPRSGLMPVRWADRFPSSLCSSYHPCALPSHCHWATGFLAFSPFLFQVLQVNRYPRLLNWFTVIAFSMEVTLTVFSLFRTLNEVPRSVCWEAIQHNMPSLPAPLLPAAYSVLRRQHSLPDCFQPQVGLPLHHCSLAREPQANTSFPLAAD